MILRENMTPKNTGLSFACAVYQLNSNLNSFTMAKTKTATAEKPMINKIAGKVAFIAGEVVGAKNAIVEMAGGAIDSVKSTVHNITAKKPAARKAVKKVVKKASTVKKTIKKAEK